MEKFIFELIESVAVVVIYIIVKLTTTKFIDKLAAKFDYSRPRVTVIKKLITFLLVIILGTFLLFIWGVKQSELLLFISSLLTVVGIAFFAQWSILSNVTSTFIIFFNHQVKIGDKINVFDKDYPIEGTIIDVGVFFTIIKNDEGEEVSIPNNIFIQKMIKKAPL